MKAILKEQKEKMPLSVVTSFIAKGWDEVGSLTEMIKSIKDSFSATGQIEEYLQNIVDAYLVCIGQMEIFLQDKKYVDLTQDAETVKESLAESNSSNESITDGIDEDLTTKAAKINTDNAGAAIDNAEQSVANITDEDWVIDWAIDDDTPIGAAASGTAVIDMSPTPEEIAAAKHEFGGGSRFAPECAPNSCSVLDVESRHPVEDDFYIDFNDDFPAPSTTPLSNDDIENLQGVSKNIQKLSD